MVENASRLISQRKKAREALKELFDHPQHVNVIHYSCESFYNDDEKSARIVAIVIRNLDGERVNTFSISQIAETRCLSSDEINAQYDDLERQLLCEFYIFVQQHLQDKWLHWNMRDDHYGFDALAHRYKVLNGIPVAIPEEDRIDLAVLLRAIYGPQYVAHPQMQTLIEMNRLKYKGFLTGKEEAVAFEKGKFSRMHLSTLRKVDAFCLIAEYAFHRKLKTKGMWKGQGILRLMVLTETITQHWLYQLLSVVALLFALFTGIDWIQKLILAAP